MRVISVWKRIGWITVSLWYRWVLYKIQSILLQLLLNLYYINSPEVYINYTGISLDMHINRLFPVLPVLYPFLLFPAKYSSLIHFSSIALPILFSALNSYLLTYFQRFLISSCLFSFWYDC